MKRQHTRVIGFALYLVTRALLATWRIKVHGQERRQAAAAAHKAGAFCLAVWHEHLAGGILGHRGQKFAPLASLSADGDVATEVLKRLGYYTVRGSSSRGGAAARDELVAATASGWSTALTVDGPRGPRRVVKSGAVDIARRAGVAIVPAACFGDRQWVLRSWDQCKIPKPFSRVIIAYGEPIHVPSAADGADFAAARSQVQDGLAAIEQEAQTVLDAWRAGRP